MGISTLTANILWIALALSLAVTATAIKHVWYLSRIALNDEAEIDLPALAGMLAITLMWVLISLITSLSAMVVATNV